jgi:hypothetical protein
MGIKGLWNVRYHTRCSDYDTNYNFQQILSETAVSHNLTELVLRDGFERRHCRKYRMGIDAR